MGYTSTDFTVNETIKEIISRYIQTLVNTTFARVFSLLLTSFMRGEKLTDSAINGTIKGASRVTGYNGNANSYNEIMVQVLL
ncbi:hypothetical protein acsn021_04140 [Anaerocolumna cellulosilytica]|uniref:Uncharacterized protein n=1 Tax=Anaerocolumna cellulosilytica TaxID=433286 RepID=A0A6S6QZP6_9FIRM|nr:hypothetical protein [Anaerocolumna cellulosilytica]MBB5197402.1 hypothetical protein [Anaerocolumna cellulosilytica]BCJ92845.1 hypothetical protein acsn021_04140 [Anaerocolumna cellulosilytica]